ncbi:MAG TPA: hypothetical protein P5084_02495, partial [Paludibacter sp.]|nr:hypothetical protein [Paludibacter sp.]
MKRKKYFISGRYLAFCLSFMLISALKAQDITSGLIIHYDFESVTETTVPDISGNGNFGQFEGEAALVDGYNGKGLNMTNKADFLNLPDNFTASLTSFTYATWVNFSALKNATRFFDLGNGADGTNDFLAFIPSATGDNTNMRLRYRQANATGVNVDGTTKVQAGTWAHV